MRARGQKGVRGYHENVEFVHFSYCAANALLLWWGSTINASRCPRTLFAGSPTLHPIAHMGTHGGAISAPLAVSESNPPPRRYCRHISMS